MQSYASHSLSLSLPLQLYVYIIIYIYSALFGDMMGIPCHVYLIVSTHVQRIYRRHESSWLPSDGRIYIWIQHVTCHGKI